MVTRCGRQCVVDLLDYLIMKHPIFCSCLCTFSLPHIYLISAHFCNRSSLHLGEFNINNNRYRCQQTDHEKESRSRARQSHW